MGVSRVIPPPQGFMIIKWDNKSALLRIDIFFFCIVFASISHFILSLFLFLSFLFLLGFFFFLRSTILFIYFVCFLLLWVLVAAHRPSLAAVSWGYSSLQCMASHCSGFSCAAWALGTRASVAAVLGLGSCSTWALVAPNLPRPGIKPASSDLPGGFFSSIPPGKSLLCFFKFRSTGLKRFWFFPPSSTFSLEKFQYFNNNKKVRISATDSRIPITQIHSLFTFYGVCFMFFTICLLRAKTFSNTNHSYHTQEISLT